MSAEAIAATNARLSQAIAAADAAAAAACYTQDARFLAPNHDAFAGRESIQAFMQGVLDSGIKALILETLSLEVLGDTAWEEGLYELHADGGNVADRGKFIVVWKRAGDDWLLHRDVISTSLPAA